MSERRWPRWWVAAFLLAAAAPCGAQSVAERTPNLDDGWTVTPGIIQFNFLHRFEVTAPPARKVTSFPNFHLAAGVPLGVNLGLDYSTNSTVFTGIPNEYQLSLRRQIVRQAEGKPLGLALSAGYNFAPQSVDGELAIARRMGPVRLLGTVRGISSGYDAQRSLWGLGGGAVLRLTSWLSLAGDVFDLVNAPAAVGGTAAWGAAAQVRIPYSPHSLSIQVTNTQSASIEGSSRGVRGAHMAGFEFTIPFTLARYFSHRAKPSAARDTTNARAVLADTLPVAGTTVIQIVKLSFQQGDVRVKVGGRVRWINRDRLQHSVTSDEGAFDSGLIDPGQGFERTFDRPGVYPYHCTPHPFMHARDCRALGNLAPYLSGLPQIRSSADPQWQR